MKFIFTLLILSLGVFANTQNETLFVEANDLYNNGQYKEAIAKYELILETDKHSSALYYNLANAHYKLNNIAPSIYYYEKAKQLNPNDKDIQNNLAFAENMTVDAIDDIPKVGFSRIFSNMVNTFSVDAWSKIAIGGVLMFVFLFLMYHFSEATAKKRVAFIISVFGIFISIFSLVMAFQKSSIDAKDNPAIIFAQETRVRANPNRTSEEVFRLHEGTKVQLIESYNSWYKIEIADKTSGWIPSEDIKPLNNF